MDWLQALLLGIVQGLTEFLPVSSSGHLAIGRELLGVEDSGDLVFEVAVHAATVLATIVVFRKEIWKLLCGLFKFRYNDETDYIAKICVSMIPVLIVGVFFKDSVEALFGSMTVVGIALLVTACLLAFSDWMSRVRGKGDAVTERSDRGDSCRAAEGEPSPSPLGAQGDNSDAVMRQRNGISFWQALVVGVGQACAVIPGLSRSGTTISTGLICGVKRSQMAQFSFLMVLVPILGEAFLDVVGGDMAASSIGFLPLAVGFVAAFFSGLLACKVMIALVRKAQLKWFGLYCALVGVAVLVFLA